MRKPVRVLVAVVVFALVLVFGGAALILERGTTRVIEVAYRIDAIAFSPDGEHFATLGHERDPTVALWSRAGALVRRLTVGRLESSEPLLRFTADGRALYARRGVTLVKIDPTTGAITPVLVGANVETVAPRADVALVSTTNDDRQFVLDVWRLSETKRIATMPGEQVSCTALSCDGALAALGVEGASLQLRATATGALVRELETVQTPDELVFSPRGTFLTGTKAATDMLVVWSTAGGPAPGREVRDVSEPMHLAFDPTERSFAIASRGDVELWSTESLEMIERVSDAVGQRSIDAIAFSGDGCALAWVESEDEQSTIHLCPLDATGRLRRRLLGTR